jgi:hypothetical protein
MTGISKRRNESEYLDFATSNVKSRLHETNHLLLLLTKREVPFSGSGSYSNNTAG